MKVKDLQRILSNFSGEDNVVIKHIDGRATVVNLAIRAYYRDGRVNIDGYHREQKG